MHVRIQGKDRKRIATRQPQAGCMSIRDINVRLKVRHYVTSF